jgi:hypothetical protein
MKALIGSLSLVLEYHVFLILVHKHLQHRFNRVHVKETKISVDLLHSASNVLRIIK